MSKSKRGTKKGRREPDETGSHSVEEPQESATDAPAPPEAAMPKTVAGIVLAWLVPGAGHLLLGRWPRAVFYFVWVLLSLAIGCSLDGRLPFLLHGSPLQVLATLGTMGAGLPYFLLRFGWGYTGDLLAPGYEYGSAFILSAGLMNLLLVLDTWDIAIGRKS